MKGEGGQGRGGRREGARREREWKQWGQTWIRRTHASSCPDTESARATSSDSLNQMLYTSQTLLERLLRHASQQQAEAMCARANNMSYGAGSARDEQRDGQTPRGGVSANVHANALAHAHAHAVHARHLRAHQSLWCIAVRPADRAQQVSWHLARTPSFKLVASWYNSRARGISRESYQARKTPMSALPQAYSLPPLCLP